MNNVRSTLCIEVDLETVEAVEATLTCERILEGCRQISGPGMPVRLKTGRSFSFLNFTIGGLPDDVFDRLRSCRGIVHVAISPLRTRDDDPLHQIRGGRCDDRPEPRMH